MRTQKNIVWVLAVIMACIVTVFFLPQPVIAGSLEPPPTAFDGSGNPVSTMHPKPACKGNFYDNGNETVTDCKTGLTWMVDANGYGSRMSWDDAKTLCDILEDGTAENYEPEDNSLPGDWHLPTIEELKTLVDVNYNNPAMSNTAGNGQWTEGDPFENLMFGLDGLGAKLYWSATPYHEHSLEITLANGNQQIS